MSGLSAAGVRIVTKTVRIVTQNVRIVTKNVRIVTQNVRTIVESAGAKLGLKPRPRTESENFLGLWYPMVRELVEG